MSMEKNLNILEKVVFGFLLLCYIDNEKIMMPTNSYPPFLFVHILLLLLFLLLLERYMSHEYLTLLGEKAYI